MYLSLTGRSVQEADQGRPFEFALAATAINSAKVGEVTDAASYGNDFHVADLADDLEVHFTLCYPPQSKR